MSYPYIKDSAWSAIPLKAVIRNHLLNCCKSINTRQRNLPAVSLDVDYTAADGPPPFTEPYTPDGVDELLGLPDVVFHSLRHSSTTYKLKLNHGDIKATQGDTGHAQAQMVTEVYAHILDEKRKINAQKFEIAFYANPDMRQVERDLNPPKPEPGTDLQKLLTQLQENPELASQLKAILYAK